MADKKIVRYLEREVTGPDGRTTISYDERPVVEVGEARQFSIRHADGTYIVLSVVDVDVTDPERHEFLRKAGTGTFHYPEVCVLCNKGPDHQFHRSRFV